MNTPHVYTRSISVELNTNRGFICSLASRISSNYCAITDSTSTSMRLNSSRQLHAPDYTSPEKSLAIILYSIYSEQLKTTQ